MALRWILMNPLLGYKPVGFLDADPFKSGRNIHGIPVIGGLELLEQLLDLHKIDGVILAEMNIKDHSLEQIDTKSDSYPATSLDQVVNTCQRYHCWVRSLKLDFELIE
jgi:FlaA1/EpsC-like NDP-sugar epimerase